MNFIHLTFCILFDDYFIRILMRKIKMNKLSMEGQETGILKEEKKNTPISYSQTIQHSNSSN